LDKTQTYLHQFAVFFDKNLVKYIFGIMEYSNFGILHLRIIILELSMGVFSTKYIIKITSEIWLGIMPMAYIIELKI
jgi:hypothetical protein